MWRALQKALDGSLLKQVASVMELTVEHVRKEYGSPPVTTQVLEDISFVLASGETIAITGASGSGKSTLLNIIGSLDKPTSGQVRLGDIVVSGLSGEALANFRNRDVGFVFQEHHLLPQCTALENVLLPTLAAPHGAKASVGEALLDHVGLAERMHAFPAQLSGGERQRVAIARALINGPDVLLCDEPTGNLDRAAGDQVGALFNQLASERHTTLIVVTHNLAFARKFSRCAELRDGVLHERYLEQDE